MSLLSAPSRRTLFTALAATGVAPMAAAAPARTIALTIDDLLFVPGVLPDDLANARRVTRNLLATLKDRRAPALGLVNAARLEIADQEAARTALLADWVRAGASLGNHSFSHADYNTTSVEAFESEVTRGGVVVDRLNRPGSTRYFRFPQNHLGPTLEKKQAMEIFLAAHGWRLAPHTIDTSDFVFDLAYTDAVARADGAMAARLRTTYLDFVMAATDFAELVTPQMFGRDIPQVLLLHANHLNADCLGDLLARYAARGYRLVTLDQALTDPAYRTPDTLVTTFGPTWLWRWRKSLNLKVSFAGDPDPPDWVKTIYDRVTARRE